MNETRTADSTHTSRRAVADILSVCRHARPASATRWLTSFAAHMTDCQSTRSLVPADRIWVHTGARFQRARGALISLPGAYTAQAREMYCRNVYLRTGFVRPRTGWVLDLGANRGLFSVWTALAGAQAIAVEAQQGFEPQTRRRVAHKGVSDRVHVEIALAGGTVTAGANAGVVAEDQVWAASSHGAPQRRPAGVSVAQLMSAYQIGRVGLLKVDIEGGEFAVFGSSKDLRWLGPGGAGSARSPSRFRCRRLGGPVPPTRLRCRPARQRGNPGSWPALAGLSTRTAGAHEHLVREVPGPRHRLPAKAPGGPNRGQRQGGPPHRRPVRTDIEDAVGVLGEDVSQGNEGIVAALRFPAVRSHRLPTAASRRWRARNASKCSPDRTR